MAPPPNCGLHAQDRLHFMFPTSQQGWSGGKHWKLSDLLPMRFGPLDLLEDRSAPLLLQPQGHPLHWEPAVEAELEATVAAAGEQGSHLREAATAALAAATQVGGILAARRIARAWGSIAC